MSFERIKEWFFCITMCFVPLAGCITSWCLALPLWINVICTIVVVAYYFVFGMYVYKTLNNDWSVEDCYGGYDPFD